MLNTFIKTKGVTKTLIHNNNKNYINELNWDADYDGEKANISLDIDENGTKGHLNMKMNNDELAELLNIPSENTMLDERLYNDFLSNSPNNEYKIIEIEELPKSTINNTFHLLKDSFEKHKKKVHFANEKLTAKDIYTHISSPEPEEEILFPLVIQDTKTRRHRSHKRPKSHVTYKVYRKNKNSTSSHRSRPVSHNTHSSRKTLRRHKHHGYSRRTF